MRSDPVLWHVAEQDARSSIRRCGLLAAEPVNTPGQPCGVYAFRACSAEAAWELFNVQYAFPGCRYDVWRVNALGLALRNDPAWDGESMIVSGGVFPSRLTLAATFTATDAPRVSGGAAAGGGSHLE